MTEMKRLIGALILLGVSGAALAVDPYCPSCGPNGLPPICRQVCHYDPITKNTICDTICQ